MGERKNILLINPPKYVVEPIRAKDYQPTGLLRVGAYLMDKGHNVRLIDCDDPKYSANAAFVGYKKCGNWKEEKIRKKAHHLGMPFRDFEDRLKQEKKPDEIYVTSSMTYYWETTHEIIKICKKVFPGVRILLGGLYATLCPEHAKKSGAEVFRGEMWEASNYPTAIGLLPYKPTYAVIKSTRGCPNNCSYCAVHILEGHKMRYRQPRDVVNEIKNKLNKFGIRDFHMWESNLLMDAKNHIEKILDLIIKEKLKIRLTFPEGLQPNLVYERLAKKMKVAGVVSFALPLESTDECLCKGRFHRKTGVSELEKAVAIFQKVGYKRNQIKIFVLVGLADQSLKSIVSSCIKAWELGCKLTILPFTPIPGTEEFKRYRNRFKNKKLDELHPFLWPCADNNLRVKDLEEVFSLAKPFFPLVRDLKTTRVSLLLKKELIGQEIKLRMGDIGCFEPKKFFYLFDITLGKKELTIKNGKKIVQFINELKEKKVNFCFRYQLPRCLFSFEDYLIVQRIEFLENRTWSKTMKKCQDCLYYKRRGCNGFN